MENNREQKFQSLSYLIGDTPLLKIRFRMNGHIRQVFAKAEHLNMTGSIKDRMALHILKKAFESGRLKAGDTIVEATSGNTGISFAAIGRSIGHPVTIFMPDWMSRERVELIQSLGAKIHPVSREEGGFVCSINLAEETHQNRDDCFLPSQFSNSDNIGAHHDTTASELWCQLHYNGNTPDAFVAGVGTGGTIMGVGRFLKGKDERIKIHPMEPANSPTLTAGRKIGKHRIQGISDEFIPAIVDLDYLDSIVSVSDGDAILMSQRLASELGLAVGISSGANFLAAIMVQNNMDDEAVVATVFPDDNKKYLSTDLLRSEPVEPEYLGPNIELIDYSVYKRVCHTYCDIQNCNERSSILEMDTNMYYL